MMSHLNNAWEAKQSQKPNDTNDSDTSTDNAHAFWLIAVKIWSHSEQQTVNMSGYWNPSSVHLAPDTHYLDPNTT